MCSKRCRTIWGFWGEEGLDELRETKLFQFDSKPKFCSIRNNLTKKQEDLETNQMRKKQEPGQGHLRR
jgi:hypothetical protein